MSKYTLGIAALLATIGAGALHSEEAGEGQSAASSNGPTSASGRIKVAEKSYDEESATFSIVFTDGTKSDVDLDKLPANIQRMLALHGLSQKLGDSYASVKGNVAEAKAKYQAVLEQLYAGEWKKAREAGEGGAKVTELAEAIARFKNLTDEAGIAKANAVVAAASKEQVAQWKANAKIKAIIAQIRAEKAAKRAEEAEKKAGEVKGEGAASDDDIAAIDLDAVTAEA